MSLSLEKGGGKKRVIKKNKRPNDFQYELQQKKFHCIDSVFFSRNV